MLGVDAQDRKTECWSVWCECDWLLHDYWDQEFGSLLSSPSARCKGKAAKPAEEKDAPVKEDDCGCPSGGYAAVEVCLTGRRCRGTMSEGSTDGGGTARTGLA